LSARLAAAPLAMTVVTPDGPVSRYENERARPAAPIVGSNFMRDGRPVGSLAIWSNPDNLAGAAPWYVINAAEGMRFVCAAVLAPKVRKLDPAGEWRLQYRMAVQADPWTPQALADKAAEWSRARLMRSSATEWNDVPAKQSDVRLLRQFFDGPTATLSGLELHVTTLAAGETSHAPHRHPNEELVIVKEGTVEVLVNGEIRRVGPGSVIFNASNELHALRNVGEGPATYHVINWRVPEGK
jgi:quercetin dioxygenase-like cupin family protein